MPAPTEIMLMEINKNVLLLMMTAGETVVQAVLVAATVLAMQEAVEVPLQEEMVPAPADAVVMQVAALPEEQELWVVLQAYLPVCCMAL